MWYQVRSTTIIGALWVVATGCTDIVSSVGDVDNTDFVASESFAFTLDVTTQTRFRLEGINGNVTVTGDPDATAVDVSGLRQVGSNSTADARANLVNLRVEVDEGSSEFVVRTEQPDNTRGRNYSVTYDVTVPDFMIQSIANVNGNVIASGISNDVAIGNVNGNVTASGVFGDLSVGLVNGNVVADVTLPPSGDVALATVNGNVSLTVPQNVSAELEATWVNGGATITNLTLQNQQITENSIRGVFGAGDGTINIGLTNGTITVVGR
jgi:DUF4097 and DUF4098 domain-containing protein YvlB